MLNPLRPLMRTIARRLGLLAADRNANVTLISAAAILPLLFAVGFGVDYGRAMQMQTKLNAIADSAALSAVAQSMIAQTDTAAVTAATNLWNAETANLPGVTISNISISAPTGSSGALAGVRVATVTYTATVKNLFGGILGKATLPIGGTSQAKASQPPSINFYVVLDTSPSMLLPTTTDGINKLTTVTAASSGSTGCAFACHSKTTSQNFGYYVKNASGKTMWTDGGTPTAAHPISSISSGKVYTTDSTGTNTDSYGNKYYVQSNGWYTDTWWLARNYGSIYGSPASIPLRIDAETSAAQNLITYAQNMETTYNTATYPLAYQMQFFTFSYSNPVKLTPSLANVSTLSTASIPDLGLQTPLLADFGYWTSLSTYTNDADTDFTSMFTALNNTIPTPGTGSTPSNPQAVMFIVTDGMIDQNLSSTFCFGRQCSQLASSHLSQCTTIKNRGIRIAILYTEYLPATINNYGNSTMNSIASTNIPQIETALQSCASTNADGSLLYSKVAVGGDISAALNKLFAMSVQTAFLSK